MEPLPAILAGVGPGVAVYQQVGGESAAALETFPALLALEQFLRAVHRPAVQFHNSAAGCVLLTCVGSG